MLLLPPLLGLYASCVMADREKAIEVFKRMCEANWSL